MSKAGPLGRAATYRDLCEDPDHLIAEILEGDLSVSPHAPAPRHQHTAATSTAEIVPPFQHGNGGPGGWRLMYSPRFISPTSVYRILLDGGAIGCRRSTTRRT